MGLQCMNSLTFTKNEPQADPEVKLSELANGEKLQR